MPISVADVQTFKATGRRFVAATCYESLTAKVFDNLGVPVVLTGDRRGMVVLGFSTGQRTTMTEMLHHCRAVRRGLTNALLVCDLPFDVYSESDAEAAKGAMRMVKEGGAQAVRIEGPRPRTITRIAESGVPVFGHLGLAPHSARNASDVKVHARSRTQLDQMVASALQLQDAGASAIALEAIPADAGREITEALTIPTMGIGAGPFCDGQVMVSCDVMGMTPDPVPHFVKRYAHIGAIIASAMTTLMREVDSGDYPGYKHSYDWPVGDDSR